MVKIKEGHWYRRRDGGVVGPMARIVHPYYPFTDGDLTYTTEGAYWISGTKDSFDLVEEVDPSSAAGEAVLAVHDKMMLRDQFATSALAGLINSEHEGIAPEDATGIAKTAYVIADAMLAARKDRA